MKYLNPARWCAVIFMCIMYIIIAGIFVPFFKTIEEIADYLDGRCKVAEKK